MKIAIFINPQRLTPELKAKLESTELTDKYGISYDLFIIEHNDLESALKSLNFETYNACVIGGGDGTVRTAVQVLCETELPLIILPLGTFNVLAKSMNYPNDIDEIFNTIKNKKSKQIDVGEVNGRVFLNHAWLGFYYNMMKVRKQHQNIVGKSKLLKSIFNIAFMFRKLPVYTFKTEVEGVEQTHKTCLILISNNESSYELANFGKRPLLATGLLHVTIINCHTRWQLFQCMMSILIGNFKNSSYVEYFSVDKLTISTSKHHTDMVLDGDLFKMEDTLEFINHKNKLNMVLV